LDDEESARGSSRWTPRSWRRSSESGCARPPSSRQSRPWRSFSVPGPRRLRRRKV